MMLFRFVILAVGMVTMAGVNAGPMVKSIGRNGPDRYLVYHTRDLQAACSTTCAADPITPVVSTNSIPNPIPCADCGRCSVRTQVGCGCTTDCCSQCPPNTRCTKLQEKVNPTCTGSTCAMMDCGCTCVSCACGFCDRVDNTCCKPNGNGKNCNPNNSGRDKTQYMDDCNEGTGRFPHLGGTGNICSGIEVNARATPNGCGCQPGRTAPCTYDQTNLISAANKCFVCDVDDLIANDPACSTCLNCVKLSWTQVSTAKPEQTHSCINSAMTAKNATALAKCFRLTGANGATSGSTLIYNSNYRGTNCFQNCSKIPVFPYVRGTPGNW